MKRSIKFAISLFYASLSQAACFGEKCLITEADIAHCRNLYGAEQTKNACAPKCVPTTPAGTDVRKVCVDSCYQSFTHSFNACIDNHGFMPEEGSTSVSPIPNRLSLTDVDPRMCVRHGKQGSIYGIKFVRIKNVCDHSIKVYYDNGYIEDSVLILKDDIGEMQSHGYHNAPWPAITRVCVQGGECR